jgi:hypothetical protein
MQTFEDIRPGVRLRGLDPSGIAEVVQVARFGSDALNLVFRVDDIDATDGKTQLLATGDAP